MNSHSPPEMLIEKNQGVRVRADLRYIGTDWQGWQSQPNGKTVQDVLESCLLVATGTRVRIVGASRTDSGVHARHQVATFMLPEIRDLRKLQSSLNALLPDSISITELSVVDAEFHPILSSTGKLYRYQIWNSRDRDPFIDPFAWRVSTPIDWDKVNHAIREFVGRHDFTSFCAADSTVIDRNREIYFVAVINQSPLYQIWIAGDGFLKQMVRSIVGTVIEAGRGSRKVEDMAEILAARDRKSAGLTAQAKGLCLMRVFYGTIPTLEQAIADGENRSRLP
jgi:tRNA pseudouridine38-40 synthase